MKISTAQTREQQAKQHSLAEGKSALAKWRDGGGMQHQ